MTLYERAPTDNYHQFYSDIRETLNLFNKIDISLGFSSAPLLLFDFFVWNDFCVSLCWQLDSRALRENDGVS